MTADFISRRNGVQLCLEAGDAFHVGGWCWPLQLELLSADY